MSTAPARRLRMTILPPDERPNTAGYAYRIAGFSGVEVLRPPEHLMPRFRQPGDPAGLADWLRSVDTSVDAHIISLDLLVHGGLVPSRLTSDSIAEVIGRLEVLRELTAPVHACQVITRLPHYDSSGRGLEEPEYWATHGRLLFELSQSWDRYERGEASAEEVAAAERAVPGTYREDLLRRRLRNHVVTLAALDLAADGVLTDLVITSDDTAERGLPAADRLAVGRWARRLHSGALLYPGADEVPSTLVARVAARARGLAPRVYVDCPESESLARTAPYEDRPVGEGIAAQVEAVGGVSVDRAEAADLVLLVHGPAPEPGDWTGLPITEDTSQESSRVAAAGRMHLEAGRRTALADLRYANGSDPQLVRALDDAGVLGELVAYGGWNTAGNTIGTTLAAGVSALHEHSAEAAVARREFRDHKIIEDGHYLPVVRRRLQEEYAARGLTDPPMEELAGLAERVAGELTAWAGSISALGSVRVRNVRWPRSSLFIVDFDVEGR
ncbi:DUF4127 family protein [Ruania albidiflava]|uniref:DUF4127 family protein n=1 Tax=Ruania albidiflava TaxID=366586 RepID=UPI0009FF2C68|nr:DUF4127 family protein [Ruania albidiflava]